MLDAIKKRRSIRRYQELEVEDEKVMEIISAAMCSPSGYHRNPWQFIIIKKDSTIEKLAKSTNYASFMKSAPVVVALVANEPDSFRWLEDTSVAAGYMYLEAVNQGLGTCWVQVYDMETPDGKKSEDLVRSILKVPKEYRILCMMPIGYPAEDLPEHDEKDFDKSKIHSEKW